jgi:hypothetical protein
VFQPVGMNSAVFEDPVISSSLRILDIISSYLSFHLRLQFPTRRLRSLALSIAATLWLRLRRCSPPQHRPFHGYIGIVFHFAALLGRHSGFRFTSESKDSSVDTLHFFVVGTLPLVLAEEISGARLRCDDKISRRFLPQWKSLEAQGQQQGQEEGQRRRHGENAIQPRNLPNSAIASFMLRVQSFFSNGFMLTDISQCSLQ